MTVDGPHDEVVRLDVQQVLDLRVRVLRRGTPVTHANYAEDNDPAAVHLGVVRNGEVIATSTWIPRPFPDEPSRNAIQLKGMAVETGIQRSGLGRLLIDAGLGHTASTGAELVWARARDSALGFYESCGFDVVGSGFIDDPTAMPHHHVVRRVATRE